MTKIFTKPIFYLLLLLGMTCLFADAQAQNKQVSLEFALQAIGKKYKTNFAYKHEIVQNKLVDGDYTKAKNLDEALKRVLYPHNLLFLYVSEGNYTIIPRNEELKNLQTGAQEGTASMNENGQIFITGQVFDESGNPLPGATVKSNGDNRSISTDANGQFSFFIPSNATTVGFSYIGYQLYEVNTSKVQGRLTIRLKPSLDNELSEVKIVSTGYQKISPERTTGAAPTITAKELEKIPVANVVQRLESMIPGVKVSISSGDNSFAYGNTQRAINSGTRTIGRSDYNMSIRGSSTLQGESFPLVVVDGSISELDLSALNPNDIESITFLKDAASASIWGVRAANGVIVVTTKRGKNNQAPKVSFSTTASLSNKPDLDYLRIMSSTETMAYEKELVDKGLITTPSASTPFGQPISNFTDLAFQLKAGSITQAQYDAQVAVYAGRDSRSQLDKYILQPAANQQYNLSVSGGGNSSDYFYSASYSNERPNAVNNSAKRLTVSLNNTFKLFQKATLSTSIKGSFFNYKNNGLGLNNFFRPSATTFMPYDQLVDEQGNRVYSSRTYYKGFTNSLEAKGFMNWDYNALDELDNNDNTQHSNNYSFTANLNIPIFKGFSASGFFNTEKTFDNSRVYYNEQSFYYRNLVNNFTPNTDSGPVQNSIGLVAGSGILNTINSTNNNYTVRGQLDYDNTFGGRHQLTVIAGSEIRQTEVGQGSNTLYGYNTGTGISRSVDYFTPYTTVLGYAQPLSGAPSQQDKTRRYLSYYSNAGYTLDGKYTLSASVRYDDYNNFGVDRKFRATPLWSSGLKWDIKKESFLASVNWISNLSLRATYGVNGNISTDLYPFTYIGLGDADLTTGLPYASIIAPANPELRWEKTYVTNIGLNFGLLNNRISGTVDYYRKNGKDLFYEFPINGTYGVTTLTRNSSEMTGKGVDLGLTGVIYTNNDWNVSSSLNFGYNTNEVTDSRFAVNSSMFSNPAYARNLVGLPNDKIMVYKNAGLDANGMTQIFDENGNKVAVNRTISSIDALKFAGRMNAPYFGAFNTTLRYKQFTLLAVATYQFGNVFLKPTVTTYPTTRRGVMYDLSEDVAKRWQKAGDENTTVVPGAAGVYAATSLLRYQQSDINVLKGDYIRLRELSMTYQIPVDKITRAVKAANFGFSVRNLGLLWTANDEGFDPDFVGGLNSNTLGLPAAVSYNFSLNVNF